MLPGSATLKTYDIENIEELDAVDSLYSVGEGGWDTFKVLLFSEATYGDSKVITEVLMRRDSFSKYSYFSDKEKPARVVIYIFIHQMKLVDQYIQTERSRCQVLLHSMGMYPVRIYGEEEMEL